MNIQTLKVICKLKHLSQSDIARMAGVSRQATSLWFKEPDTVSIHSTHLYKLSCALQVKIDDLMSPLPLIEDKKYVSSLKASLLWDHLYPDFEDFVIALVFKKLRAVARLVEVYGLWEAGALVGNVVWKSFQKYKKYLPPVRRQQCEHLWNLQQNLNLN